MRLGGVLLGRVHVGILALDHAEHQVARLDVVLIRTLRQVTTWTLIAELACPQVPVHVLSTADEAHRVLAAHQLGREVNLIIPRLSLRSALELVEER